MPHAYRTHPWKSCAEAEGRGQRHPVLIAGGGPVGLTTALELAAFGVTSVVFEDGDQVSEGSRGLCWAKRTLEILDRHGVAKCLIDKGYTWNTGRLFHGEQEIYHFVLQDQGTHKFPAFVNVQQYYAEEFLVEAVERQPLIDLRWQSKVIAVRPSDEGVEIDVEMPGGTYTAEGAWLVAADGTRSAARRALGLEFQGDTYEDCFLIADVEVHARLPKADRRFWFHPAFHAGDTALCHKQADEQWRVDFQLGPEVDREAEKTPEKVIARAKKMLGDHDITVHWASIYTFQGRRLERFRHGRVLFAGDSAHQVSPFGARGGNSGIQDAENLAWKLAYVIQGKALESLLDSYDVERGQAAAENIRLTGRSTRFLTPKSPAERVFRDAVLKLAEKYSFARGLVNSGRLSVPTIHHGSPLSTETGFEGGVLPGEPCPNLLLQNGYLLDRLPRGFCGLSFGTAPPPLPFPVLDIPEAAAAFNAGAGAFYLIRPDQHVAARWQDPDPQAILDAHRKALGG